LLGHFKLIFHDFSVYLAPNGCGGNLINICKIFHIIAFLQRRTVSVCYPDIQYSEYGYVRDTYVSLLLCYLFCYPICYLICYLLSVICYPSVSSEICKIIAYGICSVPDIPVNLNICYLYLLSVSVICTCYLILLQEIYS